MAGVADRAGWPVVRVWIDQPADLDAVASELESILEEETPFALCVLGPETLDALHGMLWAAPAARRRLRRMRPRLAAWCETTAHVLPERACECTSRSELRLAQLIWGCSTVAAPTADEASDLLGALLADRLAVTGAGMSVVAA